MPSLMFRLATCFGGVDEAPACLSGVLMHAYSSEYTMAVEQATLSLCEERCPEQLNNVLLTGSCTRQDLLEGSNDVPFSGLFTREDLLARVQMQNPYLCDESRIFQAFYKKFGYTFFLSKTRETSRRKRPRKPKRPRSLESSLSSA